MSGFPEREEFEKNLIAERAFHLWNDAGEPANNELRFWLLAEAVLQAQGKILARPVALPFLLSFTVTDVPGEDLPRIKWVVPERFTNGAIHYVLKTLGVGSEGRVDFIDADPFALLPNPSPHDARLAALQVTAAAAAIERFVGLADSCLAGDLPPSFLEENETRSLKAKFRNALFAPDLHQPEISEIDNFLRNASLARQAVASNVVSIELGSNVKILSEILTWDYPSALTVLGSIFGRSTRLPQPSSRLSGSILPRSQDPEQDLAAFHERAEVAARPR